LIRPQIVNFPEKTGGIGGKRKENVKPFVCLGPAVVAIDRAATYAICARTMLTVRPRQHDQSLNCKPRCVQELE
jgi:hypothetical protein